MKGAMPRIRMLSIGLTGVVMLAVFFFKPHMALAQGQLGAIAGVVKDSSGAVMPGVTVEASSPALIEKVRSVVTDSQGLYKIIDLRSGTFVVTFTLPGFNAVRREGIEVLPGVTANIDADLRVGDLQETVTVSGQSPIVDVQNVVQQKVMTRDVMDLLPTGRTYFNFAVLIPGMTVTRGGNVNDVGGQFGDRAVSMSMHGSREADSQVDYDGMPITNAIARGGAGSMGIYLNNGMIQEISIASNALSAEHELSGVTANVIPKEGGNTFRGNFLANYSTASLQSDNLTDDLIARGLGAANSLKNISDVNPGLGGPLMKDRLWLFWSLRRWGTNNYVANSYVDGDFTSWQYTPTTEQAVDNVTHFATSTRFTWQASPRNKVNFLYDFHYSYYPTSFNTLAPSAWTYNRHQPQYVLQATWSSPYTSRLLFEGGAFLVANDFHRSPYPGVPEGNIAVTESTTGFGYRSAIGGTFYGFNRNNQFNYRGSASYVTGTHAMKVGVFLMHGWVYVTNEVPGDMKFTFTRGVPSQFAQYATPIEFRERLKANLGLYAQDQWTINRMTVNLGIRYDYLNAYVPAQHLAAGRFVPARDFAEVPNVPNYNDISPRLGVSYNLFGSGRTAIKATLGRYVNGIAASTLARAANPVQASVNSANRAWNDANGNFFPDCDFSNPQPNRECTGRLSDLGFGGVRVLTHYDPDTITGWRTRGYNWETSLSAQHELISGVSLNGGYYRRWFGNFTVTQNLAVTANSFDRYCITAPVDARLPGGGGSQICGYYDVTPTLFGQNNNLITSASKFGEQEDVYDGVDFSVNARLPRSVLVSGGISKGRQRTNSCYLANLPNLAYTPTAGVVAPRSETFCDIRPPFQSSVKLYGVYPWPWWDIQTSVSYQGSPGPQILASATYTPAQIAANLNRNPSSSGNLVLDLIPPGTMYGSRVNQTDFRLSKNFRFGRVRAMAAMDVFNLFNGNAVTSQINRYGPTWLAPVSILNGRLVKFGMQVDF
jgi:hypothetical protein